MYCENYYKNVTFASPSLRRLLIVTFWLTDFIYNIHN